LDVVVGVGEEGSGGDGILEGRIERHGMGRIAWEAGWSKGKRCPRLRVMG
jgi:hypothetical protein